MEIKNFNLEILYEYSRVDLLRIVSESINDKLSELEMDEEIGELWRVNVIPMSSKSKFDELEKALEYYAKGLEDNGELARAVLRRNNK